MSKQIDVERSEHKKLLTNEEILDSNYVLYPQRWLVLASFGLLSMSSSWIWMTFSPIAVLVATMWQVNLAAVDALAGIYFYIYVPCSFLSLYMVVNYIGLHRGLMIGGVLNATGAIMRTVFMTNYRAVYVGTVLTALAQTFTLSTPPLIAGNWFGSSERTTATALGVLANQIGTAIGLGATIMIDFTSSDNNPIIKNGDLIAPVINHSRLLLYLTLQSTVAIISLLLVIIFGGDQPSTPPSLATMLARYKKDDYCIVPVKPISENDDKVDNEMTYLIDAMQHGAGYDNAQNGVQLENACNTREGLSYFKSVEFLFSEATYLSFLLSFGIAVGIYYTVPTFLSQLLPSSWTPTSAGWLGVMYQVMGVMGSFFCGIIVDKSQQHRFVCICVLVGAVVTLFIYTFAEYAATKSFWSEGLVDVCIVLGVTGSGMTLAAWNTLGLEFGTSLTYPADEAAVAGVLECSAELLGFVFVSIGGYLIEYGCSAAFVGLLALATLLSAIFLTLNKAESKRPN